MKTGFLLFLLAVVFTTAYSQTAQNIKGRVIDSDSKLPLVGATVVVEDSIRQGAATDADGHFIIKNVPVGRHKLQISCAGYESITVPNIVVTSGKEVFLTLELTEISAELETIVVKSTKRIGGNNEMTTVSSRTFDAGEAERYPGSRQDPARMASNFAGVQGTDDSRNDIVVRGNSPLGVLWRFEGIDIPNPSHFSVAGTTGGPLSILNNKVIGQSDFMTGAFPAEYGNALSGVFDIRMRNGNREKYEYTAQIGILGLELMSEGPINRAKGSTYIATYRYSTFAAFQTINFNLGTEAIPRYQDASFKMHFPLQGNNSLSIWGIGGLSSIDIVFSDDTVPTNDLYGLNDRDQYFRTNMGSAGFTYATFNKKNLSSKLTFAQSAQEIRSNHYYIVWDSAKASEDRLQLQDRYPVTGSRMYEGKTSLHWRLNKKFNARNNLRLGIMGDYFRVHYIDSARNEFVENWIRQLDARDQTFMVRAYAAHKFRMTQKITLNGGINLLYFHLNRQFSPEPRLGMTMKLSNKASWSLAYGLHSRTQPLYVHYYQFTDTLSPGASGTFDTHNKNIGLTKSHHLVSAFDYRINDVTRVKTEVFYQYLYQVPVEAWGGSFSLINQGSGFARFFPGKLVNEGSGNNYGIELTLEKFFDKNYFFLGNVSLYNSTYKGQDGVERNTDFNGNFIVNGLFGYEKTIGKKQKNSISTGMKITWAGGRRYSPVDSLATAGDPINVHFVEEERNSLQFPDYFRVDLKLGYKINGKRATHEFALDLLNITNHKNLLTIVYANDPDNPGSRRLTEQPQLAFLPLLYYKVDF